MPMLLYCSVYMHPCRVMTCGAGVIHDQSLDLGFLGGGPLRLYELSHAICQRDPVTIFNAKPNLRVQRAADLDSATPKVSHAICGSYLASMRLLLCGAPVCQRSRRVTCCHLYVLTMRAGWCASASCQAGSEGTP